MADVVDQRDTESWARSHVAAFSFFALRGGCCVSTISTGVLRTDIYDRQLNRAHRELAEQYGVLPGPCRATLQ